jgi:hypothetical protein
MKVCVFPSDPVSRLFQILPKGNKIVIHQGSIIQSTQSFENCGIVDQDRLFVFIEEQHPMHFDKIERKSIMKQKEDRFELEIKLLARKDLSRMMDVALCRIENNEKNYRQFIQNYLTLGKEPVFQHLQTCLNWEEIDGPNDKILPNLW